MTSQVCDFVETSRDGKEALKLSTERQDGKQAMTRTSK